MNGLPKRVFVIVLVAIICGLSFSELAFALGEDFKFRRITIEDGLSQTTINDIYQDKQGYMWIGTSYGLNRYDGKKFKVYKYNDGKEMTIPSNFICKIVEDSKENLWVATNKGLSKISKDRKKIQNYISDTKDKNTLSHYNTRYVFIDSKNRLWVGTEQGLNLYDEKNDKFERFYIEGFNNEYNVENYILTIEEDKDGVIWVGTRTGVLFLDEENGVLKRFKGVREDEYINKIYTLSNGEILIATEENGIKKYNKKEGTIEDIKNDENDKNSLPHNGVDAILEDDDGNLWIGTNKGIALRRNGENNFENYIHKEYDQKSLTNDYIISLYQDKSGLIWVGTFDGLNNFNPKVNLKSYVKSEFEENSLSDNIVYGIYEDNEGLIWVGTNGGGLNVINKYTNEIKYYQHDSENINSISNNRVWQVVGDGNNEIWIATSGGLDKFDKSTGLFTRYKDICGENSLVYNDVVSLHIDKEGILWIGTRNGLCSFDRKSKFTDYSELMNKYGISDRYISSIYEDSDGMLWLGCGYDGGLIRFDRENMTMKSYTNDKDDVNSLSYNSIKSIAEDSKGNLWIGTAHGLNRLDKENEKFIRYGENEGITNTYIYGILFDDEDNPWISTNGGIFKLNVKENRAENFDVTDGLQSNEFNIYSYYRNEEGIMYFGGIKGIDSFDPKEMSREYHENFKIKVESVRVNGNENSNEKYVDLDKGKINLPYNKNNISIELFVSDYRNPSKISYLYKLKKTDNEWIYNENNNNINYSNLHPGKYELQVIARDSAGNLSDELSINIVIDNPPWLSPIAYLIYAICAIILIFFGINYVRILEKIVEQRTLQLHNKLLENKKLYNKIIEHEQYKNNYFINLSHELRTPLNVILSTEKLVTELNKKEEHIDKSKLGYYMSVLNRNSKRLLSLINNIIDTAKIDAGFYKLNITENDIVYLVEEVVLSMKDFAENSGLELIIDPEVEEKVIECDAENIERCIINLIGNAIKFTDKGGKIEVGISDNDEYVTINVKDTGIGIEEKNYEIIFDRFSQGYRNITEEYGGSGLGLTFTKQIINLHKGDIRVKSEVGVGSEFIIILPVKQY